jgi:hypothetical protein
VSEEFALAEIASAHRQIETGHTFGKLVVRIQREPARRERIEPLSPRSRSIGALPDLRGDRA